MLGSFVGLIVSQRCNHGFQTLGMQKSKGIFDKHNRKPGPKKVSTIEAEINQNGIQVEARSRQHFQKYKKMHPEIGVTKRVRARTAIVDQENRPWPAHFVFRG